MENATFLMSMFLAAITLISGVYWSVKNTERNNKKEAQRKFKREKEEHLEALISLIQEKLYFAAYAHVQEESGYALHQTQEFYDMEQMLQAKWMEVSQSVSSGQYAQAIDTLKSLVETPFGNEDLWKKLQHYTLLHDSIQLLKQQGIDSLVAKIPSKKQRYSHIDLPHVELKPLPEEKENAMEIRRLWKVRGIIQENERYIAYANQTVRDKKTGLLWEQKTESNKNEKYTWKEAKFYGYSLVHGGYNDWRLPSKKELENLVTHQDGTNGSEYFSSHSRSNYWTSTVYAPCTTYAWIVNFSNGDVSNGYQANTYYVRCVR